MVSHFHFRLDPIKFHQNEGLKLLEALERKDNSSGLIDNSKVSSEYPEKPLFKKRYPSGSPRDRSGPRSKEAPYEYIGRGFTIIIPYL